MNTSTKSFIRRGILIIAALCLSFSLALIGLNATISHAQTNSIVVTSLADSTAGVCPDATNCTLRAAIDQANRSSSPTTITFSVSGMISLTNSFSIGLGAGPVTVDGSGQTVLIDGGKTGAIFIVNGSLPQVTLNHLVIQHSQSSAIQMMNGSLTIANSQVINNAGGYLAGGLDNIAGNVLVLNSLFTGNSGGAINAGNGHMTIANSIIVGNQSNTGAGGLQANYRAIAVVSSVIAQNTSGDSAPDVYGAVISLGHNLIGIADGSSFSAAAFNSLEATKQSLYTANLGTVTALSSRFTTLTPSGYPTATATITPTHFTATVTLTQPPIMQNNGSDQIGTSAAPLDPLLNIQPPIGNTGAMVTVKSGSPLLGNGLCTGVSTVFPAVPAITTDLKGNPRGNPCTIGAYEN